MAPPLKPLPCWLDPDVRAAIERTAGWAEPGAMPSLLLDRLEYLARAIREGVDAHATSSYRVAGEIQAIVRRLRGGALDAPRIEPLPGQLGLEL